VVLVRSFVEVGMFVIRLSVRPVLFLALVVGPVSLCFPSFVAAQNAFSIDAGTANIDHPEFHDTLSPTLGIRYAWMNPRSLGADVSLATADLGGILDVDLATSFPIGRRALFSPRAGASMYGGYFGVFRGWNAGVDYLMRITPGFGVRADGSVRMMEYNVSGDAASREPMRLGTLTAGVVWTGHKGFNDDPSRNEARLTSPAADR